MKIISKLNSSELRQKYDLVIGWGVAKNEYERNYNPFMYKLDYMIDGEGKRVGEKVCGHYIYNKEILNKLTDKKILFVVYPNIENEIIEFGRQIGLKEFDTVSARLIFSEDTTYIRTFSENYEDVIFLDIMKRIGIENPYYIDIGVCHPVIRNNTYLMYENEMRDGLLIEPNPEMCELIREYRPHNKLVCGGGMRRNIANIKLLHEQ